MTAARPLVGGPTIPELLARGVPSFSFEFFPPRDDAGAAVLWRTVRELEGLRPTFVSVTYGAGGSSRDRTIEVTRRISQETTLTAMGHLTCVGSSRAELRSVVGAYADAGVRAVMALRGDPPSGVGTAWEAHPDGPEHADELVALVRSLGDFSVGVAAFPDQHPESTSLDQDARVLAAKQAAGAEFAVTQFFFGVRGYRALVDRARAHGCTMPIIPGVMPVTSLSQIERMATLSGADLPTDVVSELRAAGADPARVRAVGVDIATRLSRDLLAAGAPGLHFYTLNRSSATREIYRSVTRVPVG